MAGLAQIITPTVTGRILITVCGVDGIAATTTTGAVTLRFGTGAPPGNGTALTGTVISNTISFANNTAVALSFPFSVTGIATGLTLGVPIWIDLAQSVSALTGITVTATEI
jgi:hypothetical protein